jgi:hypothetical protein
MQHLNTLNQLVQAASQVTELARASQTYRFPVSAPTTFYLHVSLAEVRITRRPGASAEVQATLGAPFAWRVASDQDEAGIYFVAHRRPLVGALAVASFHISVPPETYLILKLDNVRMTLDDVNGTVELPPGGTPLNLR